MNKSISIVLAVILVLAGAELLHAQRISVKANIANVRSGPDTNDTVVWQVEQYHPLKVIRKQGSWYLFEDFEGDRGWIHDSLVAEISTVIVKSDNCNVRSGPGTDQAIQFTVDKGVPFKVLKEQGDWLRVVHADGDQGWIHRSLVW